MVGARRLTRERHIRPFMLAALLAQAASRNLNIGLTKQWIAPAFLDRDICRRNTVDVRVVDVVVEPNRGIFAGRVIEHALGR